MTDELMTWREVAEWLRVSKNTLELWRRGGTGPAWLRLDSGRIRYRRADVQAWLDALAKATNAEPLRDEPPSKQRRRRQSQGGER